jgi:hypothetical protein
MLVPPGPLGPTETQPTATEPPAPEFLRLLTCEAASYLAFGQEHNNIDFRRPPDGCRPPAPGLGYRRPDIPREGFGRPHTRPLQTMVNYKPTGN